MSERARGGGAGQIYGAAQEHGDPRLSVSLPGFFRDSSGRGENPTVKTPRLVPGHLARALSEAAPCGDTATFPGDAQPAVCAQPRGHQARQTWLLNAAGDRRWSLERDLDGEPRYGSARPAANDGGH